MPSGRPVNGSKRELIPGDHGRGKLHRKLVRFGLAEAADNLGISTPTLRRKLQGRGIECDAAGTYSLRQIVEGVSLNGDSSKEISLAAHGKLQNHRARLTELQVMEAERELLRAEPVMKFIGSLAKATYRCVETFDLSQKEKSDLCYSIQGAAEDYCNLNGNALLTLEQLRELKAAYPHLRSESELWARSVCESAMLSDEKRRPTRTEVAAAN
jgi:hypothetical protein